MYFGPIPHPDTLKKFGDIDSSFPERIMRMTEDNNKADVTMRNRLSFTGLVVPLLGQVFSFLISCIGFGVAIVFGLKGIEAGTITATIGGIAPNVRMSGPPRKRRPRNLPKSPETPGIRSGLSKGSLNTLFWVSYDSMILLN
jgi:uncharacterized membrane protein